AAVRFAAAGGKEIGRQGSLGTALRYATTLSTNSPRLPAAGHGHRSRDRPDPPVARRAWPGKEDHHYLHLGQRLLFRRTRIGGQAADVRREDTRARYRA